MASTSHVAPLASAGQTTAAPAPISSRTSRVRTTRTLGPVPSRQAATSPPARSPSATSQNSNTSNGAPAAAPLPARQISHASSSITAPASVPGPVVQQQTQNQRPISPIPTSSSLSSLQVSLPSSPSRRNVALSHRSTMSADHNPAFLSPTPPPAATNGNNERASPSFSFFQSAMSNVAFAAAPRATRSYSNASNTSQPDQSNISLPGSTTGSLPNTPGLFGSPSTTGTLTTTKPSLSSTVSSSKTPYRSGFQPKGVWRVRTEDFMHERIRREEGRRGEERRLGRRLEKLIELHFTPPAIPPLDSSSEKLSSEKNDSDSISSFRPSDLWKGIKQRTMSNNNNSNATKSDEYKRSIEQKIVKWEDDSFAKKCPICQTPFSFANRKHHCRLCGKVVCSLPPTPMQTLQALAAASQVTSPAPTTSISASMTPILKVGTRKETCSLLIIADYQTGRAEQVEDGFVGYMRIPSTTKPPSVTAVSATNGGTVGTISQPPVVEEMKITGVRVCRDCWNVVSRRQYLLDAAKVPAFTKLYNALRRLQEEIEESLPEYHELALSLHAGSSPLQPAYSSAADLRRQLLDNFSDCDALAKRIRSLPCSKGSGQEKLQLSILVASTMFLQKHMAALQPLPKQQSQKGKHSKAPSVTSSNHEGEKIQKLDSQLADLLQPLLEQELQLEAFIEEANAQRKFEDVKTLQISLEEIRFAIGQIASG